MSDTQGEEKAVSLRAKVIGGAAIVVLLAAAGIGVGVSAHAAQVKADAEHAMTLAAPAYEEAIKHGGSLDTLGVQSAQAKKDYDTEQARLAAEKAAQEAAAAAAAQAAADAAQAAADEAARQAAEQPAEDSSNDSGSSGGGSPSESTGLPAGSVVPSIPGTDAPDTTKCASGSASTVNGVPTCD